MKLHKLAEATGDFLYGAQSGIEAERQLAAWYGHPLPPQNEMSWDQKLFSNLLRSEAIYKSLEGRIQ